MNQLRVIMLCSASVFFFSAYAMAAATGDLLPSGSVVGSKVETETQGDCEDQKQCKIACEASIEAKLEQKRLACYSHLNFANSICPRLDPAIGDGETESEWVNRCSAKFPGLRHLFQGALEAVYRCLARVAEEQPFLEEELAACKNDCDRHFSN
jgi:hypothetical protein